MRLHLQREDLDLPQQPGDGVLGLGVPGDERLDQLGADLGVLLLGLLD
jgi:hypothetical protein